MSVCICDTRRYDTIRYHTALSTMQRGICTQSSTKNDEQMSIEIRCEIDGMHHFGSHFVQCNLMTVEKFIFPLLFRYFVAVLLECANRFCSMNCDVCHTTHAYRNYSVFPRGIFSHFYIRSHAKCNELIIRKRPDFDHLIPVLYINT